jgi:hypothetical protein
MRRVGAFSLSRDMETARNPRVGFRPNYPSRACISTLDWHLNLKSLVVYTTFAERAYNGNRNAEMGKFVAWVIGENEGKRWWNR